MSIKILTKTGEEITHIDDARAYNFDAGNRSGIVKGAYNEGRFYAVTSNVIGLDSCELRIAGHRIVIDSAESITLTNTPANNTRYSMIAEIVVNDSSTPSFRLFIQPSTTALTKDNLYKTAKGNGTYQLEIGRFTLTNSGTIIDVIRTADVIIGGSDGSLTDIEFNATAYDLESNKQPEVNVDFNEETKKYDMRIGIPRGQNGLDGSGSNPNLLINGDFKVNQRGQESYSTANAYTVDRWKIRSGSNIVFDVATKKITYSSAYSIFLQQIEDYENLKGKTITFSVKCSEVSGTVRLNIYSSSSHGTKNITSAGTTTLTATIPTNITSLSFMIECVSATGSITPEYIKLEIGSIATPFIPRPYAEELALCQRYYVRLDANVIFAGRGNSSTTFSTTIPLPVTQRINGSIIVSDFVICKSDISHQTTDFTISSIVNNANGKTITVTANDLSTLSYRNAYNTYSTQPIEFDAEIY